MKLRPFVIDCDTGRDDALAFWAALSLGLPLVGAVASYGNTSLRNVIDNTARVLALSGRDDLPLLAGACGPLQNHKGVERIITPRQAAAGNGLCNLHFPPAGRALPVAGDLAGQIHTLAKIHGPLDYVIIGPATNLAALCAALGPAIHNVVARVTMMGGKFDSMWEQFPGADFNVACDPAAVQAVLAAGYALRFVPVNATWPVFLTQSQIESLIPETSIARAAQEIMLAHCRHFAPDQLFRFHDPCVITACMEPVYFSPANLSVMCDDESPDHGRLIQNPGGFAAEIYKADDTLRAAFLAEILNALGFRR